MDSTKQIEAGKTRSKEFSPSDVRARGQTRLGQLNNHASLLEIALSQLDYAWMQFQSASDRHHAMLVVEDACRAVTKLVGDDTEQAEDERMMGLISLAVQSGRTLEQVEADLAKRGSAVPW